MSKTIIVSPTGEGYSIAISAVHQSFKDEALEAAALISRVTNPQEEKEAITHAAKLKGLIKDATADHKEVKRPYKTACDAIDTAKNEFIFELDNRVKEIESLVTGYKREEQRKIDEARRKAEQERRDAEAKLQAERNRQAELERQAKAAQEAALQAKSKAAKEKAQQEADRLAQEAEAARFDVEAAQDEAVEASSVQIDDVKSKGGAYKEQVDFEVTDGEAFYQWDLARRASYPDRAIASFVKIEVPKTLFKQFLNTLPNPLTANIPGIRVLDASNFATRAKSETIQLQ